MSKVKYLSFEELAGNLAEPLNKVRTEQASIVVEYPSGEKVLIKPYSPAGQDNRGAQREESAPSADDRKAQPQAQPTIDPDNISSVGAVYDLDPGSITPG